MSFPIRKTELGVFDASLTKNICDGVGLLHGASLLVEAFHGEDRLPLLESEPAQELGYLGRLTLTGEKVFFECVLLLLLFPLVFLPFGSEFLLCFGDLHA